MFEFTKRTRIARLGHYMASRKFNEAGAICRAPQGDGAEGLDDISDVSPRQSKRLA